MTYDYKKGTERINNIISNRINIVKKKVPKDDSSEFTFDNAYYGWVTAIFVDIRNSTKLFATDDANRRTQLAKMIRAFTSETIEILRDRDDDFGNLRTIGVRGDCVFAVYATPKKNDIYECANLTFYINCLIDLLQKKFKKQSFLDFEVGVGMATAQELVVKAGRKDTGINDIVWIGKAVSLASRSSGLGKKNGNKRLLYSSSAYTNFIDECVAKNREKARGWFTKKSNPDVGTFYDASIVKSDFDRWVKEQ
jgi:class 3 adenylate cyclase